MLKLAHEGGCPWNFDECISAVEAGSTIEHAAIREWLRTL
jgi:hypothetical protein